MLAACVACSSNQVASDAPLQHAEAPLSALDRLYIVRRPPLGDLHLVELAGESSARTLLAASLQGLVNRTAARMYLLHGEPSAAPAWEASAERNATLFWLNVYAERYGLHPVWSGDIDAAVRRFGGEVRGYLLVSEDEPWTISAATTLAAVHRAVIATPAEAPSLEAAGVAMLESLIGRWPERRGPTPPRC